MKYTFQLPNFPNSSFELESSLLTGKQTLFMDNMQLEKSDEKGKPFLIPTSNKEYIKAFPKLSIPDYVPKLEINGNTFHIVERLHWVQYSLGATPLLLVFIGGLIGGGIGGFATITCYNIFRKDGTDISKYLKVIGIILLSFTTYFVFSIFLMMLFNK